MYQQEESIYNIVKETPPKAERPPRYKSSYNGTNAPTGSTFNIKHTSRPGVSNLAGEPTCADYGSHKFHSAHGNFGLPPAKSMPDPTTWLKGKSQNKPVASLKQIKKERPDTLKPKELKEKCKPPLPSKEDKPILNLVTSKNFIVANAVEAILAAPKKTVEDDCDFLCKEDFGKVPAYLTRIKKDIEAEYQYIRDLKEAEIEKDSVKRPLTQEERHALLQGLKAKWEEINTEYQLGTHLVKLDTVGKKHRKEMHEAGLTQIEKYIEKIKRENILVDPSF